MIRLAILGSGSGSNALNIIEQCKQRLDIQVAVVICNIEGAGILDHAKNNGIPAVVISNNELKTEDNLIHVLQQHQVDWIVLAGFLRKIGSEVCQAFPNKILNIHPALLPKYGEKACTDILYMRRFMKIKKHNQELPFTLSMSTMMRAISLLSSLLILNHLIPLKTSKPR